MKYLALMKDSLVEALDRKSLTVMIVISLVFILLLASISFSPMEIGEVLQDLVKPFGKLVAVKGTSMTTRVFEDVTFTVSEVRELGPADEWKEGYEFRLTAKPLRRYHELVRTWDALNRNVIKRTDETVPDLDKPVDAETEIRFLRQKLVELMIPKRDVVRTADDDDSRTYHVRIKPSRREVMNGAYKVNVCFGLTGWRMPLSVAMFTFLIQKLMSEYLAGMAGCLVGIAFTAGFVPNMLQKGSLDVLLSKPVGRSTLLLYKFLGGMTYAAITGAVFIGGSWLVLSLRSGIWNWGYLGTFATLMLFFGVLYSIGTLVAVVTRSTIAAILVPVAAWVAGSLTNFVKGVAEHFDEVPKWVGTALEAVSWFLPRAGDINRMNDWFVMRGSFGADVEEAIKGMQEGATEIAWIRILISSGLMIVVMLSAACLIFSRRDH